MPDHSETILPLHEARTNKVLAGVPDLVMPSYDGLGIANIPASVSQWLGGPNLPTDPLAEFIRSMFKERYKRVVLLLVDALGYGMLQRYMAAGKAEFWRKMLDKGQLFPLTSVTPSTTATALTTFWTGLNPNQHAYIGYEMWLKELGITINNILHMPTNYVGDPGSLSKYANFDPVSFNKVPSFGQLLSDRQIEVHAYQPAQIVNSGLSQMHLYSTQIHGYVSPVDLWVSLRENLNSRPANPKFIWAYWPEVDTLMHRYGPDDERTVEAFSQFSECLENNLFRGLEPWAAADTLFLMTADHGAVYQPYVENNNIRHHTELLKHLQLVPTCEARLPFLYVKDGHQEAVRDYFSKTWPGEYTLITRQNALDAELFGLGENRLELQDRIGDLIAVSHDGAYLWWPNKVNTMLGRHGGLHREEMLVPLFGFDLA